MARSTFPDPLVAPMSSSKGDIHPSHVGKPSEPHSAESAIMAGRREKAQVLRARGDDPFANDVKLKEGETINLSTLRLLAEPAKSSATAENKAFSASYDESKVAELFGQKLFHVRGRVLAIRRSGGLSFLKLRDGTGEMQMLLNQALMGEAYEELSLMDLGDILEVEGKLIASKRGELSIEVKRFRLLTKSYRPLPEKWHGLTDIELRYRRRYVDLIASPKVSSVFRARSKIVQATRKILDAEGFLEVETPSLHSLVGGAAAKPFETHHHTLDMRLFLRIAPELHLKRLLVGGFERVYEIGRCYRNEGISTRHNPEFTMLEFYQAYASYLDLQNFAEVFLRGIDSELEKAMPAEHAVWKSERPFTLDEPFVRVPMNQAVMDAAIKTGIPAWKTSCEQILDSKEMVKGKGLVALLTPDFSEHIKDWSRTSPRAKNIDWGNFRRGFLKCDNEGDRLFCLYEYLVEPFLSEDYRSPDNSKSVPVMVYGYPYETSPLARKNDAHPELVDRFELFVHGKELCNAFSELNDPGDQADRFRLQVEKKAAGTEETMDYDEDYIMALEYGMPPAAGFGMGIDRLVMMLTAQSSIRDVILFPLLRAENKEAKDEKSEGGRRA